MWVYLLQHVSLAVQRWNVAAVLGTMHGEAFGCMYTELNFNLSTSTKKKVYQATVLPVLLYEVETCKTVHLKCLAGFHNHCSPNISDVWSAQYVMWLPKLLYILYNLDPLSLPIACSLLWTSSALTPEGYTACSQHVNCASSITGLYGWNR